MSSQPRLYSIDLIRLLVAVAIIIIHVSGFVVAISHQVSPDSLNIGLFFSYYFRWGTPIFIMISGYLLIGSNAPAKTFYRQRTSRLAIPFVFWNIFYYFLYTRLNSVRPTTIDFINRISGGGPFYHLYFLYLISGLYLITPLLNKYIIPKVNLNIFVPILMILSYLYVLAYVWLGLPQLNNAFTWFVLYIGYYLAGYWFTQIKTRPKKILVALSLILPFIAVLGNRYFINLYGYTDQGEFVAHRLSYFIAIPACLVFLYLVNLKNAFLPPKYLNLLNKISSLSFGVYLIHPAIIQIFVTLHPFADYLKNYPVTWMFILIPLVTILSFLSIRILKSLPLLNRIV